MVKMGLMGQSGHTNIADYRHGVLVGNWYENEENEKTKAKAGEHLLGFGGTFTPALPTSAAAQHPEGRVGAALAASYARTDLTRVGKCVPAPLKFSHGDPHEPPIECFATINQLAFGEKCQGEPRVQQYLWSGKTKLNANVPISSSVQGAGLAASSTAVGPAATGTLSQTKRSEWKQLAESDRYSTTSLTAAAAAATLAAATAGRAATTAAAATAKAAALAPEQGAAPVGRKPVGAFAAELDKNYHVMQLRK